MTHKDEIFVCSCKENPTRITTIYKTCSRCKQPITPYLPSSSVKELVDAAKNAHFFLRKSGAKDIGGPMLETLNKLETALKPFEEEKNGR